MPKKLITVKTTYYVETRQYVGGQFKNIWLKAWDGDNSDGYKQPGSARRFAQEVKARNPLAKVRIRRVQITTKSTIIPL